MFKILLTCVCLFSTMHVMALQSDTSAYQTQRLKVNSLLAERSAKFGQYDESLKARTGIFGFQTKNDIRNSNEILRAIILNDNNIFKELKILMNYKDMEVQEVQNNVSYTNKRIEGYKVAIRNLQAQNDQLRSSTTEVTETKDTRTYVIILLSLIIVAGAVILYRKEKYNV